MAAPTPSLDGVVSERKQFSALRSALPLTVDDYRSITSIADDPPGEDPEDGKYRVPVTIISLANDDEWKSFDDRMRFGADGNMAPWNRIISILRGHGANVCVIEHSYVCLDYRSEFASFYSQLNEETAPNSQRLHFFEDDLTDFNVFDLSSDQCSSYLGYVVCRSGNLPLVGRSVIRVPKYVTRSAAITEPVYFFGQRLAVEGVPFMQQDERFAVCAQVAAWTVHYSAYRRGLVERRLIADFVDKSKGIRPMRPTVTKGLVANQVATLLESTGLRAELWLTAHTDAPSQGEFNRSSQHLDHGGAWRGDGGLEEEDQRCWGGCASAVAC